VREEAYSREMVDILGNAFVAVLPFLGVVMAVGMIALIDRLNKRG
jgi:hypothetical protein